MNLLEIHYQGSGYGSVFTEAEPTAVGGEIIRVEQAEMVDLAQLAADVLGLDQPDLPLYGVGNLAKWILRFGATKWGERPFLRAVARSLIWQPAQHSDNGRT
jgi:hypothetical protein